METILEILQLTGSILLAYCLIKLVRILTPYFISQYKKFDKNRKHKKNRKRTPDEVQAAVLPFRKK